MKKIYQTPAVSVTSVSTQQMMALSKWDTGSDGDVLTRRDNEWDEIWDSGDEDVTDEKW